MKVTLFQPAGGPFPLVKMLQFDVYLICWFPAGSAVGVTDIVGVTALVGVLEYVGETLELVCAVAETRRPTINTTSILAVGSDSNS